MDVLAALQRFLVDGGWLAVLLAVLVAGSRRWWYFAYHVDDLKTQLAKSETRAQRWEDLYLDLMTQQRSLVEVVETASRRGR